MTNLPSQTATHSQEFVRSTNAPFHLNTDDPHSHFPDIRSGNTSNNRKIDVEIYEVDRPSQAVSLALDQRFSTYGSRPHLGSRR